jgi:hypothetical protein
MKVNKSVLQDLQDLRTTRVCARRGRISKDSAVYLSSDSRARWLSPGNRLVVMGQIYLQ